MYKKILVPTDGSPLSAAAITHGIGLAKSTGAAVVGMTISVPFHTFALDPMMVSDTKESYKKDCEARATKDLGAITAAARAAGVPCEAMQRRRARQCTPLLLERPREGSALIVDAKSLLVINDHNYPGGQGRGFGPDNNEFILIGLADRLPVPEPGTWILLLAGAARVLVTTLHLARALPR